MVSIKTYSVKFGHVNELLLTKRPQHKGRIINLQPIEQGLSSIVAEASFIFRIENPTDHQKALDLMDQLIEDYAKHEPLIDLLCISIEKYENSAHEFLIINQRLSEINSGISTLAILMEQHNLNTTDFQNEIGGKSLVSMILNQKRSLNLSHIRKLSERFQLSPQLFI
jgi:HTH-type transcriptional regulator/antitoxin HigA